MSKLLLTFYGDDFTGSTDALEQLTLAGLRAALFVEPPTPEQLKKFPGLQAVGVAGISRSLTPDAMEAELKPALRKLKALGAPHVHYKVCSTFDSSPTIGSIGRVIDVAADIFKAPFIPLLVGAPALGRYCAFGNLFACFGIGSEGEIHRLDRHPSMSRHPITPADEGDLRLHLAKQTAKSIGLFDILKVALPPKEGRAALKKIVADGAEVVLFDVLFGEQLPQLGELIDAWSSRAQPLFSVGSSAVETALSAGWAGGKPAASAAKKRAAKKPDKNLLAPAPVEKLLVASGSCSPVTERQIARALENGFAEVALDTAALAANQKAEQIIWDAAEKTVNHLQAGRSVIVHTSRGGADPRIAETAEVFKQYGMNPLEAQAAGAKHFGSALGEILRLALKQTNVTRICIAGGDTSSYAARSLGVEALEMIARLTPGAPLCRAHATGSPVDGLEVVFKGGQVGGDDYFEKIRRGKP
jgi:3-oxoisoapionate kinase